jgi:nucleotide-binding universal stress UspA family protein
MSAYRRVLVAVDGSAAAGKGLREAIRLAQEERAQLVILHVVNELLLYYGMEGAGLVDVQAGLREGAKDNLAKAQALARTAAAA